MPACHAGGRGFEPLPGRQFALVGNGARWCSSMAEQLICNQQVAGSNPITSSKDASPSDQVVATFCGEVPGWPKGADCKSAVFDFDGSNPSLSTTYLPAGMAELADALDSGSSGRKAVQVQVLFPAPPARNPNPIPIGEGFGFVLYFGR